MRKQGAAVRCIGISSLLCKICLLYLYMANYIVLCIIHIKFAHLLNCV
jgi:hypothetical protein